MNRDFVNTTLMTTAFKIGSEEGADDIEGFLLRDEVSRHTEHIGIVMLTRQFSERSIPNQTRLSLPHPQGDERNRDSHNSR